MRWLFEFRNIYIFPLITSVAMAIGTCPARSYPIDCAILLCLSGGFPSSAECVAAKATMLQRIAPPVPRPPLQLWNCPMGGGGPETLRIAVGADGLVPEVRSIRDGIEIYWVRYRAWRGSGDLYVTDQTRRGSYGDDGSFHWQPADLASSPDWLLHDLGMPRASLDQLSYFLPIRAIAIRWRDHENNYESKLTRY